MGGEELLNSISSVKVQGKQMEFMIDQSIRPGGPFTTTYNSFKTIKLPAKNKCAYWYTYGQSGFTAKFIIDGDAIGMAQGSNFFPFKNETEEEFYLAPEKILFIAKESNPILQKDTLVQDILHRVVAFKWRRYPVRLIFNANSGYLSFVEITRHYTDNTGFLLGDAKRTHQYSLWTIIDKKLHYPMQKDVYLAGQHYQSFTFDSVNINFPVGEDSLSIGDSAKAKLAKMGKMMDAFNTVPSLSSKEIAPGIFYVRGKNGVLGSYNSWFIKTSSGIVVLEAPVTSAYSKSVMNEVKKQFPSEKIRAVISTSDAWPHVGGLREYVACNIPVYLLKLNEHLVNRLITANYTTNPDSLQKKKAKAVLNRVTDKTVINDKDNPIELYPIKTETGERMMMVYFPKQKILYTCDLVQPGQATKFFMPQYLGEVIEAVNREKLKVEKIIGIHQPLINYKELLDFMDKK